MKTFDLEHDQYLQDHVLDQKAVVPVTFVMELMAEVAQLGWTDNMITEVHSFHFFKGIVLDGRSKSVRVTAREKGEADDKNARDIEVQVTDPEKPKVPLYRATVRLMRRPLEAPGFDPQELKELPAFPLTVTEAYKQWLFHGPRFQHVTSITGMNSHAMTIRK